MIAPTMISPRISIIIAVLNAQDTVEETLLSALNQTYTDLEVIVIDGKSVDGTVDIIKKYTTSLAYWISEPDLSLYDAMNKGIQKATGDYCYFLNAGDILTAPTIFSELASKASLADVIYTDVIVKADSGATRLVKAKPLTMLWQGMTFCHQRSLSKKEWHLQYPFDLSYKIGSDYHFYVTLIQDNRLFDYIPLALAQVSSGGISDQQRFLTFTEWNSVWKTYKNLTLLQWLWKRYFYFRTRLALWVKFCLKEFKKRT